jgi:disulfide bond formation protein DsbB
MQEVILSTYSKLAHSQTQFGKILEDLAMEHTGLFSGHLVYLMAFWVICWLSGIFGGYLVYLLVILKSGNPDSKLLSEHIRH